MRGSLVCLIAGVAATVLVAGCSSGTYGSSGSNTTTGAPAAAAPASTASSSASAGATAGGAKVATAAVSLGTILVDGQGRTLYLFEGDHGSSS
ncbi:MAG TPA: hypothetical protein VG317_20690, partial [Pseudonocardiaceae bacterium]|nr:hypothetical protein [Pseudonocardiaceae bacterium]